MGTAVEHQAKAEHHRAFLQLIPDEYPDWLTTVAFYVALELIESLFAERGIHSDNHERRKVVLRNEFPSIYRPYHALYNAALDARYQPMNRFLPVEEVRRELIEKRLAHIASFVESHSRSTA